jgi:pyridoxamine 5'-phosphate oxidase
MPNRDLSHLRAAYLIGTLELENCHEDPFVQFDQWFHQALDAGIFEPNAMTLATVDAKGQPSARDGR